VAALGQSTAGAQFLGVTDASAGNYAPFTLASLTPLTSPSATLDLVPIVVISVGRCFDDREKTRLPYRGGLQGSGRTLGDHSG